jgi:hypothetical protein
MCRRRHAAPHAHAQRHPDSAIDVYRHADADANSNPDAYAHFTAVVDPNTDAHGDAYSVPHYQPHANPKPDDYTFDDEVMSIGV